MATIKRFEDVEAWKRGRELTAALYRATNTRLFERDYALRNQMRRAAVSILSNVAEGFDRNGVGELRQFLAHGPADRPEGTRRGTKGSTAELQAQLHMALDVGYLDQQTFDDLYRQTRDVQNLLGGFLRYLSTSTLRGSKYPKPVRTTD